MYCLYAIMSLDSSMRWNDKGRDHALGYKYTDYYLCLFVAVFQREATKCHLEHEMERS